jgi:hypothetical protein
MPQSLLDRRRHGIQNSFKQKEFSSMLSGLFFMILIFIIVVLKVNLDLRKQEKALAGDDAFMFAYGLKHDCSAYGVFRTAGKAWHFSKDKTEQDFKKYLEDGRLPHYVRTFLHANVDAEALNAYQVRLFAGYRI